MHDLTLGISGYIALDVGLLEEIHHLWDALIDFGADQPTRALTYLMAFLCERVGAWNATWASAIRFDRERGADPLRRWQIGVVQALHPIPPHRNEGHFKDILRIWDRGEIDPSFLLPMRNVGTFRTYSFRQELPASWFHSPFYERHYGSTGIFDAVFVAFPLNDDCESHFGFYSRETFTGEQIALLGYALRGIKWFHRRLMLSRGLLIASSPLTVTEQRVLSLLLTEASEKQIADRLGLAASTTHQHVVALFRKFGVGNRAGLMSLWLSHGG